MKKLFFIITTLMIINNLHAQPWLQHVDMNKPQKLQDIIDNYQRQSEQNKDEDEEAEEAREKGMVVAEGKNYHFYRWVWYMERHMDEQGYIISPIKTLQEWNAYQERQRMYKAFFKTTGPGTNESQWIFQGPTTSQGGYSGIGRINVVAFHPTDSNTYWIGSAGGGAWKTTNDGLNWTNMTNSLPVLGISDIDFNPLNPNTIYLCTGDRDASDNYSVGVMKSTDGGQTWQTTGLQWTPQQARLTNCLAINRIDTSSIVLATSNGLYKSVNGGASWSQTLTGTFKQIIYHPVDTNIVYAAGSGPTGGFQIWRSANGGTTWTKVTAIGNTTRITMAVTPANPKIVKAIVAKSDNGLEGIYNSSDTGKTYIKIMSDTNCTKNILNGSLTLSSSTCGGQGWYDLAMAISPVDSNKVYIGGVNSYYSSNGGKNWQMITQWYGGMAGIKTVHADKHCQAFNPLRPLALFECNDGGIYRTYSPASTLWNDLSNGLGITEFYRNAVSSVASFVVGGAQDNGTKKITSSASSDLTGGDGMNCEMDYTDPTTFYTATQYGSINRTTNSGANFQNISSNIPGQPTGDWITPYVLHPVFPFIILAGYKRIYISYDQGNTWSDSSIAFTTSNIKRISMSRADSQYIYVLVGSNTLRYSPNFNVNWNSITVPYTGTISDILADPKDAKILWVSFSGYGTTKVARYNTTTSAWTAFNDTLPNVPVNCMAIDSSNGTMYIGTDVAVFYKDTSMTKWALFNTGMPSVEVTDLGINYTTKEIWAATYGRGMWKSVKHSADTIIIPPNGISLIPYAPDNIIVSPNPNNGKFTITTTNSALISEKVVIRLFDEKGQNTWSGNGAFNNGMLDVNTSGLAKGIYILEVKAIRGVSARTRIVIL